MGTANNVRARRLGWLASVAVLAIVFAAGLPTQSFAQTKPEQPQPQPQPSMPAPAPVPSPAPQPAAPNWRLKDAHDKLVIAAKEVVRLSNELTNAACGATKNTDVKAVKKSLKRERKNLNARAYFEALEDPEIKKLDAERQSAYHAAEGQPADSEAAQKLKDVEQRREKLTNEKTAKIEKTILEETEAAAAAECTPRAVEPPKPEPKEPEKPKEPPKEKPKATDESDDRPEIGAVPGCSEGSAQPCSAEPAPADNASQNSGGSFLGGISIGIGGHSTHHRDHKRDTDHKNTTDDKDTDHKTDKDKDKDKDQDQPASQPY